jgi:hypothetical protein
MINDASRQEVLPTLVGGSSGDIDEEKSDVPGIGTLY